MDKIKSDDLFDNFMESLLEFLNDFLSQLENYYQLLLVHVSSGRLKDDHINQELAKLKYDYLKNNLSQFKTAIAKDLTQIKYDYRGAKFSKQNYELQKSRLIKMIETTNSPAVEQNFASEFDQLKDQINSLVSITNTAVIRLNTFKSYLKQGIISYQSYTYREPSIISIKAIIKDLKKVTKTMGIDDKLKKYYLALKKSLRRIKSLASFPDFKPIESIEYTTVDADSLHNTPSTSRFYV